MAFQTRVLTNFAAGPSCLPEEVLVHAQKELLNYDNCGRSVMELSHRGKEFTKIFAETKAALKSILNIPDNYKILFVAGGGAGQFAALPLNFCDSKAAVADYIVTGSWSKQAAQEAEHYCKVNIAATSETSKFTTIPPQSQWNLTPGASYVHYCENETIHGVIFQTPPEGLQAPLVCDMSSSFLSRPFDVSKFGVIYGGAQKNAGIAGVTIVIVREDLLKSKPELPSVINYKKKAESDSLDNTPPVFNIYITLLVLRWIQSKGGLVEIEKLNKKKAEKIYHLIDNSNGFYTSPVDPSVRSFMNIPVRVKAGDTKLEELFLAEADKLGLVELKGHRSVGGLRVSLYNAMTLDGVDILVSFMEDFRRTHSREV